MPALADYTPLESLILFQSLERYGTDSDAFQKTSALLLRNEYVAEASGADPRRLSAESLKEVYDFLLDQELKNGDGHGSSNGSNGHGDALATSNGSSSPRKRKLGSRSPTPSAALLNNPHLLPRLVARLYKRYRNSIIAEIRRDEQRIHTLQQELRQLEVEQDARSQFQGWPGDTTINNARKRADGGEPNFHNGQDLRSGTSSQAFAVQEPSLAAPAAQTAQTTLDPNSRTHPLSASDYSHHATPQATSASARYDSRLDTASGTVAAGSLAAPTAPQIGSIHRHELPKAPGIQPPNSQSGSLPTTEHSSTTRAYSSPFQSQELNASSQPSQGSSTDRPMTSLPPHIRPDTSQAPISPFLQHGMESPRTPAMPMSGSILGNKRPALTVSTSSTKWKSSPRNFLDSARGSPEPDEVSPISDKAPSPTPFGMQIDRANKAITGAQTSQHGQSRGTGRQRGSIPSQPKGLSRGRRKTRGESFSSAAIMSSRGSTRSRSAVSYADEGAADLDRRQVKHEEAATPRFSADGDTEMDDESAIDDTLYAGTRSTRRTHRASTHGFDDARKEAKPERLLGLIHRKSESISLIRDPPDPTLVSTTRNFSKTTAPIMQTITGHKFASLFANPVKEKDAPGYSSMIYRPQDLKSIKAAITAGGRAVNALQGGVDSPLIGSITPQKNKEVLVPLTPDLVPPKAIVNSSQLEKEVMRMFANAVMFNQDPNRGFGPAFGDQGTQGDEDDEGPMSHYAEVDGGVVTDTREMFEAVQGQLSTWRGSLKSRVAMDRRGTEDEGGEEESEYFVGAVEGESVADDGGPGTAKRRKRG